MGRHGEVGHHLAQEDPVERLSERLLVGQQIPVDRTRAARRQVVEVWAWKVGHGSAIGKQNLSQQGVLAAAHLEDVERPLAAELGVGRDQALVAIAVADVVVALFLEHAADHELVVGAGQVVRIDGALSTGVGHASRRYSAVVRRTSGHR